jgi:hypothetical protein
MADGTRSNWPRRHPLQRDATLAMGRESATAPQDADRSNHDQRGGLRNRRANRVGRNSDAEVALPSQEVGAIGITIIVCVRFVVHSEVALPLSKISAVHLPVMVEVAWNRNWRYRPVRDDARSQIRFAGKQKVELQILGAADRENVPEIKRRSWSERRTAALLELGQSIGRRIRFAPIAASGVLVVQTRPAAG